MLVHVLDRKPSLSLERRSIGFPLSGMRAFICVGYFYSSRGDISAQDSTDVRHSVSSAVILPPCPPSPAPSTEQPSLSCDKSSVDQTETVELSGGPGLLVPAHANVKCRRLKQQRSKRRGSFKVALLLFVAALGRSPRLILAGNQQNRVHPPDDDPDRRGSTDSIAAFGGAPGLGQFLLPALPFQGSRGGVLFALPMRRRQSDIEGEPAGLPSPPSRPWPQPPKLISFKCV